MVALYRLGALLPIIDLVPQMCMDINVSVLIRVTLKNLEDVTENSLRCKYPVFTTYQGAVFAVSCLATVSRLLVTIFINRRMVLPFQL